jgi:hypothetical protein
VAGLATVGGVSELRSRICSPRWTPLRLLWLAARYFCALPQTRNLREIPKSTSSPNNVISESQPRSSRGTPIGEFYPVVSNGPEPRRKRGEQAWPVPAGDAEPGIANTNRQDFTPIHKVCKLKMPGTESKLAMSQMPDTTGHVPQRRFRCPGPTGIPWRSALRGRRGTVSADR